MDNVEKAILRRRALEVELRNIQIYLEMELKLSQMPDEPDGSPARANATPAPKPPSEPGPLTKHTRSLVRDILQKSGRAMGKEELLEEMRSRGMTVEGKDPGAVLYSRLHGAPELVNPRGIGWDLADRAAAASSLPLGPPEADGLVNQS